MSDVAVPELSLVLLIGVTGSGKSTFAARHFGPTEVVSSDRCRGMVSGDENDQAATADAFELLHKLVDIRLRRGLLTVVDATNVQPGARRPLIRLARDRDMLPVAIVLDVSESQCLARNASRPDRAFGPHVVRNQRSQMRRSLGGLGREGLRHVFHLRGVDQIDAARVVRTRLWNDRREDAGPFDIIGDVHGCADELEGLLDRLGYVPDASAGRCHPAGRKAVFLGDLVDRGPRVADTVGLVRVMCSAGTALAVCGNHDDKLVRALKGKDVKVNHGLDRSLAEYTALPPDARQAHLAFLGGLVSHYVLDGGRLVVAHAGLPEALQGRASGRVRAFAMYGETTGETDELGLPVRWNWAADYRGAAAMVYGHTPVPEPEWLNGTINIDTGCVFGGRLTALRWPERELVSVPAARAYAVPVRPLPPSPVARAQHGEDRVLDLIDLRGKRGIETRLMGRIGLREEQNAAAIEVASRFACDPRWLIYLPPTMSPAPTSQLDGLLEHPEQAFTAYAEAGLTHVVCEEKHMGSRAVLVICREPEVAVRRFGLDQPARGVCYTRTGRPFFTDPTLGEALLGHVAAAMSEAGLWDELETDWIALDAELMPWSVNAQPLIEGQYGAVAVAATAMLKASAAAFQAAAARGVTGVDLDPVLERLALARSYRVVAGRYAWPVAGIDDLRLAPLHILATEGGQTLTREHRWHLAHLDRLCAAGGPVLEPTQRLHAELGDPGADAAVAAFFDEVIGDGLEGIVVKPEAAPAPHGGRPVQPAMKVRGREYLRLIYGPEYTRPDQLARLKERSLGRKRGLALREHALGVEALERFCAREPLRRVHECALAILALESEPVDARL